MVGLLELLVIAGLGYLGYKMVTEPEPMPMAMPRPHPFKGTVRKPARDATFMQNASPYNYEPDGNYN